MIFDMVRNVAYLRVSKKEENLENQRNAIKNFANEELMWYEDTMSGSVPAMQRNSFKEMMDYIEKMHPEKLYTYEISRLGRSMVETLSVIQDLEKKNVLVIPVSEKERWLATTDRSVRNLIMAIFSWVAEREREMLIERTRNGLERAKKEGKKLGRPAREIDWKEVNKYREKGISYSAISRILDVPYSTLIRRKLGSDRNGD
ncbi:MAG: recombinase family protein [Candidatus Micrarchaeaceae archaeon]